MVSATYDHIVAIILVGVIFVWVVGVLPATSLVSINAADQQQLRNTGLNVFNAMLLDTGKGFNETANQNTTNWGSLDPFEAEDIIRFGLASTEDSASYVLDPDKVQRLEIGNPLGTINNTIAKSLMDLEGYGFALEIIPPFNVTNVDGTKIDGNNSPINIPALEESRLEYSVRVCYLDGRPIPNAAIESIAIYSNRNDFTFDYGANSFTNQDGISSATYGLDFEPLHITVIMRISVADVATMVVTFGHNPVRIIDINLVGDEVSLTRPKDSPNAEVKLHKVYSYSASGVLTHLYDGIQTGADKDHFNTGNGQRFWNKTFSGLKSYDPVIMVFNIETVPPDGTDGNQEIVVAGPYQNLLGYTVFHYGQIPSNSRAAIRMQRSVIISGMTYTAELTLWEE